MENKNSFEDYGFAKIDYGRQARSGFPEAVLCEGKSVEQIVDIIRKMKERGVQRILATRAAAGVFEAVSYTHLDVYKRQVLKISTADGQAENTIVQKGKKQEWETPLLF